MALEKKEERKIGRKKLGLVFIICGIVILALMLIPFISVQQGPGGFSFPKGPEAAVVVTHTYSPFDFVYMMFSSKYSLAHYRSNLYEFVGVLCLIALCAAITLIIIGTIFVLKKKKASTASSISNFSN